MGDTSSKNDNSNSSTITIEMNKAPVTKEEQFVELKEFIHTYYGNGVYKEAKLKNIETRARTFDKNFISKNGLTVLDLFLLMNHKNLDTDKHNAFLVKRENSLFQVVIRLAKEGYISSEYAKNNILKMFKIHNIDIHCLRYSFNTLAYDPSVHYHIFDFVFVLYNYCNVKFELDTMNELLQFYVSTGDLHNIKLLLEDTRYKLDIHHESRNGETCFTVAERFRQYNILRFLEKYEKNNSNTSINTCTTNKDLIDL